MKCLELKPRRSLIKTDHRFIAKIPLLPSKYIWETKGDSLGLLASEKRDTLLIISDNESWLNRYKAYYAERFDMAEHGDDFSVDSDFETIFGSVKFSGAEDEMEEETDSEADEEDSETDVD